MRRGCSSIFINAFLDLSQLFRQVIAIIKGSWFSQKLLKQSVLWMYKDHGPSREVSCRGI
jgi:hypothetical protein